MKSLFSLEQYPKLLRLTSYRSQEKRRNIKVSSHGKRLSEWRKLRSFYGSPCKKVLQAIYKKLSFPSRHKKQKNNLSFFRKLESRLDVVLYRAAFFESIASAKQEIVLGRINVNNVKVFSPAYNLIPGDIIRVCCKEKQSTIRSSIPKNHSVLSFFEAKKLLRHNSFVGRVEPENHEKISEALEKNVARKNIFGRIIVKENKWRFEKSPFLVALITKLNGLLKKSIRSNPHPLWRDMKQKGTLSSRAHPFPFLLSFDLNCIPRHAERLASSAFLLFPFNVSSTAYPKRVVRSLTLSSKGERVYKKKETRDLTQFDMFSRKTITFGDTKGVTFHDTGDFLHFPFPFILSEENENKDASVNEKGNLLSKKILQKSEIAIVNPLKPDDDQKREDNKTKERKIFFSKKEKDTTLINSQNFRKKQLSNKWLYSSFLEKCSFFTQSEFSFAKVLSSVLAPSNNNSSERAASAFWLLRWLCRPLSFNSESNSHTHAEITKRKKQGVFREKTPFMPSYHATLSDKLSRKNLFSEAESQQGGDLRCDTSTLPSLKDVTSGKETRSAYMDHGRSMKDLRNEKGVTKDIAFTSGVTCTTFDDAFSVARDTKGECVARGDTFGVSKKMMQSDISNRQNFFKTKAFPMEIDDLKKKIISIVKKKFYKSDCLFSTFLLFLKMKNKASNIKDNSTIEQRKNSFFKRQPFFIDKTEKPLHLEISYKSLCIVFLYPPQYLVFPKLIDLWRVYK